MLGSTTVVEREVACRLEPADAQARAASATHVLARLRDRRRPADRPRRALRQLLGRHPRRDGLRLVRRDAARDDARTRRFGAPSARRLVRLHRRAEERVERRVHSLVDDPPLSEADTITNFEAGGPVAAPIVIQVSQAKRNGSRRPSRRGAGCRCQLDGTGTFRCRAGDDFEVFADELDGFAGVDFANCSGASSITPISTPSRGRSWDVAGRQGRRARGLQSARPETSTPQTDEESSSPWRPASRSPIGMARGGPHRAPRASADRARGRGTTPRCSGDRLGP